MVAAGALWAQPSTMSINQDVGGTYANSATTLKGGVFQARFQENASSTASGTRNWQFNADGYFNTWGVLSSNGASSVTLAAYNTSIQPNAATASANFEGGPGYNNKGRLPATTANFYYTYNIIKGSSYASQLMSVLETSFDPVAVSSVTQSAGTFGSRAIGITTSGTPAAGENIFVRYSTDGYVTSAIAQATGSSTAWSATIPWQSSAVSFYVYTSNKTLAAINADVTTNGQAAHDLAMLNLNNNAGANYSWTPVTGNIIVTSTGGTGAAGVGYSTFTVAGGVFAALNAGTAHTGTVTALITADVTTETGATVLSNSAIWTSLGVQPNGARTVSGSVAAPMIDFSGADNVTIDGLNTGGNSLTVSNTNSGTASTTSTFRFIGDATNNTITNCTILGSFSGAVTTNGGTIFFSTSTTNGNDNNTISNCNIGPAGSNLPSKAIYGNGSTTSTVRANSGITINNCNIYDFFLASGANAGIYANDGNTDWTITNNKLYQTATRTFTTGATHSGIFINGSTTANNNNSITGNTIGYSSAAGTGTYTIAGNVTWVFVPINIVAAGTTTATVIQNNTIAGIAMSGSSSGTSSSAPFRGIYIAAGLTTVSGNTIGSLSATGSITYTSSSTSASDVIGIFNFGSSNWISNNNNIGGITAGNSSTGAANIYGLRANTSSSVTWMCTGNTIGGTVSNSIQSTSTATGTIVNGILNNSPIGTFTGNTIRNMSVAGGTGSGSTAAMVGIAIAASSANHTVGSNTIFNLSSSLAGIATVNGINFNGSTGTNLIEKNLIYNLDANSATASLNGINIIGGTATYRNNMISLGNTGNSATVGMAINGINETIAGTDNLYFNSIYIGGAPTTGASNSFAFQSSITTNTRAYQNNLFFNARSNSGSTGKHYAIRVGGTAANPSGLTSNYNVLLSNGTGGFTGLFNSIDRASIADWRTATGQDANSFSSDPQFLSPSAATPDLHINPAVTTVIEGNGLAIGAVTDDYDGQTRASFTPTDIGADAGNFTGLDLTAPTIAYTPVASSCTAGTVTLTATITDASGVPTAGAGLPVLYWKINAGAYTAATGTFVSGNSYSFTFGAGSVANDVISYYIVAQDNAATPNVAVSPATGAAGLTANPPAATTPPTSPSTYSILNALSGTYTVGSGGAYATLTAAVAAYNNSCLTGPVVFSLTDATYTTPAETFPISINSNAFASAVNTLTIKPATGISPTITGANVNTLLKLNGADYVIIDGSNSNTANTLCPSVLATRDLTITNTNSAAATIVWMGSTSAADGATNNIIKNTNFAGGTGSLVTFGIFSGSASASSPGTPAAAPNSNNTIENCAFKILINAISIQGVSNIASLDQNWVIRSNAIGSATLADKVTGVGMVVQNAQNFSIDNNTIAGVASSTASTSLVSGIQLTGLFNGGSVYQNKISDIKQRNTGGYGANGIYLNATSTAANVNVYNNFIWDVAGIGFSTAGANDNGYGIMVNAGGGYNIDYNTVVMNANQTSTTGLPAAINISSLVVTAGSLKIRNNLFVNAQTAGNTQRYAIYSSAANTVFSEINYNDYYSTTGPNLGFIGSNRATLANIQAGFGGNLNSVSINPVFTSATDLHLVPASNQLLNDLGTPIAGITTDIDCATRDAVAPDMGADEFTPPPCTGAVGGTAAGNTAFCLSGTPTITATGYSTGIGSGYQWISSTNAGDYPASGTPVAGQTNPATLTTGVVSTTTYYWLRVTCPSGTATDNSTLVTVTINPSAAVITGPSTKCTADPAITLTESGGTGTSWTWAPGGATTQSISVSPVATTTYSVTVTSPGACVKTATYVVTVATSPTVTATASPNPLCINTQLNLGASTTVAANTYALSAITYGPTTDPGGSSVITGDDEVSSSQTLPFTFNYFGTNYTTVFIYTNGFIQLGTSSGSDDVYAQSLPSATAPNTVIGGVWSDLNATGAAAIRAYTTGSVGSRIYTVHFSNVPFYTSATGNVTGNTDFYIQLHETTNIVEVHVADATGASTTTSNKTLGIENSGGTAAVTPAGRNAANWNVSTAAKEAYRFTPNAIASYAWTGPDAYTANTQNPSIASVTANSAGTYTIQVTDAFGCSATSTTAAVVVTPNVSAGTVSGTTPLCIGAMATYSSDGTAGGTWSSTNTSVATVVAGTGVVTAVGAGTTDIVYTVGTGCGSPVSAMQTLTVDPNANAGTVSGTTPLCIGAMATYSSNGDAGGTWSSTNTSVATVDMSSGLVTAVGAGTTDIVYTVSTGCNNPVSAMQTLTVDPTVTAGTVSGTSPLCIGTMTTYGSNGTAGGTWSSTNTSVATVNPTTGLVTAIGAGSTDIVYTVNTGCGSPVSAMKTLTVDPTVTAGTVSGTTPLCVGLTATYTSTGTPGGTWSSTNTSVATVHPTTGFVTAVGGGMTDITYTVNTGCGSPTSAFQTLTVNPLPNAGTIGGTLSVCVGQSTSLNSNGDSGGQWSSSNTNNATVDNAGLVSGLVPGTVTITYAVTDNNTCFSSTTAIVTINANPGLFTVTGGGVYCTGGAGLSVGLSGSETGVNYQLKKDNVNQGSPVAGTGAALAFPVQTASGTYTVEATGTAPVCTIPMTGSVTISAVSCDCYPSIVSASPAAYDDGWQTGDNDNPSGFGPWTLSTTNPSSSFNGHFIGSSTGNNACAPPSGDSNADGDINGSGDAWGLYANGGGQANAVRPFLSNMVIGGSFKIRMDNGCVDPSQAVGFGIQNASGNNLAEFYFQGGGTDYVLNDGSGVSNTGIGFSDEGVEVVYTRTGASTYNVKITRLVDGATVTLARSFNNPAGGQLPKQVRLFNGNAGAGSSADVFFNNMEICIPCTPISATLSGVATICAGNSANISATITGGVGPYTLVLFDGANNSTVAEYVSGANIPVSPASNSTYTIVSITDALGCGASATLDGSAVITVTQLPNPGTISGTTTVCTGLTTTLTSNGLGGGTWSSSNTEIATVGSGTGIVTGVTAGVVTITYSVTASGCPNSTSIQVTVTQTPNAGTISGTATVCTGLATTLSSNGLGGGTWSSNNLPVATVHPTTGVVTGVTSGTATITYMVSANGCNSSTTRLVTVNQTPNAGTISGTTTVCSGLTTALSSNGLGGGAWSSNNGPVATVNPINGVVTGVTGGTATITYTVTANGCTSSTNTLVTVNQTPSAGVISGTTTVCTGLTTALSSNGAAGGTWSSSNPTSASVNPGTGVVSGVASGSATITYTVTASGCTSSTNVLVTVNQTPNAGVISGTTTVCSGLTTALSSNGLGGGTWSSGNTGVATVNAANGTVTGVAGGTVTITYTVTANGCTSSTNTLVTVNQTPSAGVIGGTTTVCAGQTTQLNSNGVGGGSWNSSNTGVATINGSGLVSGLSVGTTTITYTVTGGGCTSSTTATVTVISSPNPGTISGGPGCIGTTANFTTNGQTGGTWSSSNMAVATINPTSGVLTGVSGGTTTVTYTLTFGSCSASTSTLVTVSACNAIFGGRIIWSRDGVTGVKDATVTVSGSASGSVVTPASGLYSITVSPGSSFTITPTKTLNKLNGVNAQDVFRINQHATLNPSLISNPYELVAADVNGNNVITPLDANIIQLSLLGNTQALAQWISSWRFVPTSHTMTNPPWGFPEKVTLTGSASNVDFYGIKVGDVAAIYANPANGGTGAPFVLRTPDQVLEAGRTLSVEFAADALSDIAALQFALRFDPTQLQLANIATLNGLPLSGDNFGTYEAEAGSVRMVWAGLNPVALKHTAPVFRLTFQVLESGSRLSEVLGLDDEILPGHVYNSFSAESGVSLRFDASTAVGNPAGNGQVQLLQNRPNPFVSNTRIGFVLPEACEAHLRIFDAAGRLVTERTKQYTAGRHDESFDLSGVSGLLYYELTTPFGVLAKKMTKVE